MVLCYSDSLETQRADSRTIITLLHLRDIEERDGLDISIVSEMLDLRNRALAEVTHADDFIVSARLVSLLMAQVAENAELNAVFADLFDVAGSEIYLRPAPRIRRARRRGDVCDDRGIGAAPERGRHRGPHPGGLRASGDGDGVRINPPKSTRLTLGGRDAVIVLAE